MLKHKQSLSEIRKNPMIQNIKSRLPKTNNEVVFSTVSNSSLLSKYSISKYPLNSYLQLCREENPCFQSGKLRAKNLEEETAEDSEFEYESAQVS